MAVKGAIGAAEQADGLPLRPGVRSGGLPAPVCGHWASAEAQQAALSSPFFNQERQES